MSQFNIRSLREISDNPSAKFLNTLSKRLATFLNKEQTDKLENKEDIYSAGQDTESVVKFHELNSTKRFTFDKQYFPPTEPDGDKVRVWARGVSLGNTLRDWSGEEKTISINGDPSLIDGTPFDLGIHDGGTKSTCLTFNRPTSEFENQEYLTINHADRVKAMDGLSTGASFFMRFRIHDLESQNSWSRTLYQKRDDTTTLPNNGIRVLVGETGRIIVRIRKTNGTQYNWQTESGTIQTNTVYDLWVTYTVSGNVVKVYLNNTDMSLTDPGTSSSWGSPTDLDWYLFKHAGSNDGHVYGDFYDFRIYSEQVVSAAQVGYMDTNKWTIANIPYGQVMITDYYATYESEEEPPPEPPPAQAAYTTTGYTTTGYNT